MPPPLSILQNSGKAQALQQSCILLNYISVISSIFINKFAQKCQYFALMDQSVPLISVTSLVYLGRDPLCLAGQQGHGGPSGPLEFMEWRHFVDNDISWTLFFKMGDFQWTFSKGDFSWTLLVTSRGQFQLREHCSVPGQVRLGQVRLGLGLVRFGKV